MREISAEQIKNTVAKLCIQACTELPSDVKECIYDCRKNEPWPTAGDVLDVIIENFEFNVQMDCLNRFVFLQDSEQENYQTNRNY